MKEGTIYLVISFPENFPQGITSQTELISMPLTDSTLIIYGYPDGHILILVENEYVIFSRFESQKIRFQSNRDRILTFIWSEFYSKLQINNHIIHTSNVCETKLVSDEAPLNNNESIDLSHNQNLDKWINWRRTRFIELEKKKKSERREKTEQEQVQEFVNLFNNIEFTFKEWIQGKDFLIMSLLGLLRSLLAHKLDEQKPQNSNYNPLLFRIASLKNLSLPVYARPVNQSFPDDMLDLADGILAQIIINEATIDRKFSNQIIMDFQEWLNGEVIITYKDRKPVFYSINRMLLDSSNTLGGSHFDTDIPLNIDFLKNTSLQSIDTIKTIIHNTTIVSLFHCSNVLSHFLRSS
ncbi:hypothetical protein [Parabacteroides sp. FAFU027]|uniref:hypothetical protein n=1 Tax=Parabacteroides sp. FAFU027 TaxID=2922715 RepID=UPI001FAF5EB3|nr:hypothetical protein [Parabacteroides sp. FAFU027]